MDFASNKLYPNVTLFRFRQALFCNYRLLCHDFTINQLILLMPLSNYSDYEFIQFVMIAFQVILSFVSIF